MLYTERLRLNLEILRFRTEVAEFDLIQFDRPVFYLELNEDSVGGTNLDFIVNYFRPAQPDTTDKPHWSLYTDDLRINDAHFRLRKRGAGYKEFGIDFEHLDVRDIDLRFEKVEWLADTLYADVQHISLKEQSGFEIQELQGLLKLSSGGLEFENLTLETPNSELYGELSFHHRNFRAYRQFVDSVRIRSRFEGSMLGFRDVSYFAPDLEGFRQQIGVDGRIRGPISNLKGSGMKIYLGDDSYFLGNCDLIGLPNVQSTYINLDVRKVLLTYTDLQQIQIPPFKDLRYLTVPDEFKTLGTMRFNGQFTGFFNSFVAFGNLRTDIGNLGLDLGIEQSETNDETAYSGLLVSDQFDFGRFFGVEDLGRVDANVEVNGSGFSLEYVNTEVRGKIDQLVFREYSYEDISLGAQLERNLFNGKLSINDRHISLDFDGLIDLRADTAQLDFVSNIFHMDFGALNLLPIKQYSSLTTRLEVGIQAVNVNQFKGEATALSTLLCIGQEDDDEHEFDLGDVWLSSAREDERGRVLLESAVADAEIVGKFQVQTLANSFLSVVRSALPAL